MAVLVFHLLNPLFFRPGNLSQYQSHFSGRSLRETIIDGRGRSSGGVSWFVVSSIHSSANILRSNKQSRYDEDDDDDMADFDDWLLNDDFAEPAAQLRVNGKRYNSQTISTRRQLDISTSKNTQDKSTVENICQTKMKTKDSMDIDSKEKNRAMKPAANKYRKLSEEIDFDQKWIPLFDYLRTFGLKESDFVKIYEKYIPSLQVNIYSARERLEYLLSVGVKHEDIRKMLLRLPQILGYTVESNFKPRVAFLLDLGIPSSRIGQIIAVTPTLFSFSLENSLRPAVRYLVEEVGVDEKILCKVVQRSPQILVNRIDLAWNIRYSFLSKELGASKDNVVKMVMKHPQLLHYSIDDGLLPKINFLRSIGLHNTEILKVLTFQTQVLSLSLENNLKPKYSYLINELHNEVQSLIKYPAYLSLSLDQRIRPRHWFLVASNKTPKGPFPLSSLVLTDESFCKQWARTSVDEYLAFRQQLLLKKFAKKYKRRG